MLQKMGVCYIQTNIVSYYLGKAKYEPILQTKNIILVASHKNEILWYSVPTGPWVLSIVIDSP